MLALVSSFRRLSDLVLGPPGRHRWRLLTALGTTGMHLALILALYLGVTQGVVDAAALGWLALCQLAGTLTVYGFMRCGLAAKRFSQDPSLMLVTNLHAVLCIAAAYAIAGPMRGAVLAFWVLILAYAMFGLQMPRYRVLTAIAFFSLALTMLYKSQSDPARYPAPEELAHVAFALCALLGVSGLAVRMGGLRQHLRQRREELEKSIDALGMLATQDVLTGLPNRRHMDLLLHFELTHQQRFGHNLCLAMIDLDHFKSINDKHGHAVGDAVLQAFARAAEKALRGSDVLSRWGGEEFLLMLPATTLVEADQCVERIRQGAHQLSFPALAPDLKITFSAGLSSCASDAALASAIAAADQAMYRAKAAGRNCTMVG